MKTRIVWLILSCLMALSLLLASCATAVIEEKEVVPQVEKVVPGEETTPPTEEEVTGRIPQTRGEVPLVTIEELLQKMENGADILVIDVRSKADYERKHIKGAISVPWFVIEEGQWEPPRGKAVVLY